jgi:hypothetical protein
VRFGDPGWRLGYTKDAIGSHFVFRQLQKAQQRRFTVRFEIRRQRLPKSRPKATSPGYRAAVFFDCSRLQRVGDSTQARRAGRPLVSTRLDGHGQVSYSSLSALRRRRFEP